MPFTEFSLIPAQDETDCVTTAELEQPTEFVPTTVYDVVAVGLTTAVALPDPLLHEYVLAPLAVNVAELPVHNNEVDETAVTEGNAAEVTANVNVLLAPAQPAALAPLTVYVVFTVGDTEILLVLALVFHVYELAPLAVNVTELPAQANVPPLTVTVGFGLMLTATEALAVQELASAANNVYVAFAVGDTTVVNDEEPLLHEYVNAPVPPLTLPVNVAELPEQIKLLEALALTVIAAGWFKVTDDVATHVPLVTE